MLRLAVASVGGKVTAVVGLVAQAADSRAVGWVIIVLLILCVILMISRQRDVT